MFALIRSPSLHGDVSVTGPPDRAESPLRRGLWDDIAGRSGMSHRETMNGWLPTYPRGYQRELDEIAGNHLSEKADELLEVCR